MLGAPDDKAAWDELWAVLQRTGRVGAFEAVCRQVLQLAPDNLVALVNLSETALAARRPAEAEAICRRLAQLHPDDPMPARELACALHEQGRTVEAIGWARRAISNNAGRSRAKIASDHVALALMLLADGQWSEGWAEYEWRLSRPEAGSLPSDEDPIPLWAGEDLAGGTLLVLCEQGFGDMILVSRYLPHIPRGVRAVFAAPAELADLLRRQPGQVRLSVGGLVLADRCCAAMSLPHLLRGRAPDVPSAPYLTADARKVRSWRRRLDGLGRGIRAGLVWAGNPEFLRDGDRSTSLAALSALADVDGVVFVSLQKGAAAADVAAWANDWPIYDPTGALCSFDDTAALIANLDVVITVDTAVAHLAGALGRPVWLLNRLTPHWAWPASSDGSPWYPSVRQFRQLRAGDWSEPVGRLRQVLVELSAADRRPRRSEVSEFASSAVRRLRGVWRSR